MVFIILILTYTLLEYLLQYNIYPYLIGKAYSERDILENKLCHPQYYASDKLRLIRPNVGLPVGLSDCWSVGQ